MHDPRQGSKVRHDMVETIIMVTCSVIAGCDVWEDIADYCRVKEEWFRERIGLKLANGIPSHDTMQRIFQMMDPKEFERRFIGWVEELNAHKNRDIVSVDGKTMRGSRSGDQQPIHMVSAWANEARLVLGQIATEEKSNEITAVPALLELLDIGGCIVTADAMSCQKAIAKKISGAGADYVLALKENQLTAYQEVATYFEGAEETPEVYAPVFTAETDDTGHGRIEHRVYHLTLADDLLQHKDYKAWSQLRAIGHMHSTVTRNGATSEEDHYYLTSLTNVEDFARAARLHWGGENSLHWCLDVTFREDHSRMRTNHEAENFAVIRHIALNVLKNMDDKMSVARRRRHCAYDDAYLEKVILSIHA